MGPKKKDKKPLQKPQKKNQKAVVTDVAESELSAIAPVSFIEGLEQNNGAPLHSTALEEDLSDHVEEKRSTEQEANPQGKKNKKKSKSTPQKSKTSGPAENPVDQKKAMKRKSAGNVAVKPAKKQKVKGKTTEAERGRPSDPESQKQTTFTSDEELEEDWKPSPNKRKVKGFEAAESRKSRKSSSGSANRPEEGRQGKVTPLDVVLDEFLDFYEQYKETVESNSVKKALDYFASNVEEQITEKISNNKRFKTLTAENSKLASSIQKKRQRLLDAKNELIKSERRLWLLQKEKSELEQKSEDLNRSRTFLQNVRELHSRYRSHRKKHPNEKETFDASSFPALLVEAKHVQTTEVQQKNKGK